MTSTPEVVTFTLWSGMLCTLWWGLFVVVPRQLRSVFRHRLWALRDDAMDAMRGGALPRNEVTTWFVDCVQGTIRHSSHWTLMRWLVWPSQPRQDRDHVLLFVDQGCSEMTDEQKALFRDYEVRFKVILAKQLILGSVSGWIALGVMGGVGLVAVPSMLLGRSVRRGRDLVVGLLHMVIGDMATASVRLRVYDCAA